MSGSFDEADGKVVVENLITVIHENRGYLSEIDGAIGDGDHGINMDKGFAMAGEAMSGKDIGMNEALKTLGKTLLMEIGGSMGPLYGTFFKNMAKASAGASVVDGQVVLAMLKAGYDGIKNLGEAKVGDKTMIDTLEPAVAALEASVSTGAPLPEALDVMTAAAEAGWKSTKDLVAKIGRASRLGERSRGTLDAGATSCFLILRSLASSFKELAV